MVQQELFSLAIGLVPPWMVDDVTFKIEEKRLDLHVTCPKGSHFSCPVCGAGWLPGRVPPCTGSKKLHM